MKRNIFWFLLPALALLALAATGCNTRKAQEIRVMTFNIRLSPREDFDGDNCWNNRREAAIKMIGESRPDLFGIQEGYIVQVNYLDENLPGYGRYGVCRDDGLERGEANAIFWNKERFDMLKCDTYWLSETPDTVSLGWDGACRRIVTWAQLHDRKLDRDVWFFNTHFDHVGKVAREEAGKLIMQRMSALVPEEDIVFLTGDFNANWDNPILNPIREKLQNCRETAPVTDNRNTFNSWGNVPPEGEDTIIDHIFFRGVEPLKYEVLTGDYGAPFVSDHWPVLGTFKAVAE
ncbi:MAG: endonuclease/exonuclease/phosphatase family protein [Bacteroidales bacterium]|nr:endonuclease/exonuclease/phosphatase family protein [Bacteroidales bacterium]